MPASILGTTWQWFSLLGEDFDLKTWPVLSMAASSMATFSLVSHVPRVSNSLDLKWQRYQFDPRQCFVT